MRAYSSVKELRCIGCGRTCAPADQVYTCPHCGPLDGTLDVLYDLATLKAHFTPQMLRERRDPTLWRYHELLPIADAGCRPALPLGLTPLYPLTADLGFPLPRGLLIKDDTRQPTGSSKDRATAVAAAHASLVGAAGLAAASTGNAASSLAAFAAHLGRPCYIFVPAGAPEEKLTQIRVHGAILFAVAGTYDQAFDLCAEVCRRTDLYNRSTAVNPYLAEGKKTIALEIWEQLGFRAPDCVVVPVGDGCVIGGVHKGFCDLSELGLIDRPPRMIGVQATGAAPLARAWEEQQASCRPQAAATVADSICVGLPRDQHKALRAVRDTSGFFVQVSDDEILAALQALATRAGIFAEPAAAASLAGVRAALLDGRLSREAEIVLLLSGHGLKDGRAGRRAASENALLPIPPEIDAVMSILAGRSA